MCEHPWVWSGLCPASPGGLMRRQGQLLSMLTTATWLYGCFKMCPRRKTLSFCSRRLSSQQLFCWERKPSVESLLIWTATYRDLISWWKRKKQFPELRERGQHSSRRASCGFIQLSFIHSSSQDQERQLAQTLASPVRTPRGIMGMFLRV